MDEKLDDLALSVGRGFNELREDIRDGRAAVEARLDRIEFLISGQERRISIAEDRIRQLAVKAGLDFSQR